jgi:alcohol dehydrogenase, propanol-preferring
VKAAVVHRFDQPLEIEDVPVPEPGADQVLVMIEASGLCHTDIHAARGEWPIKPSPPFIPGHEGVGVIEALGPGASHGLAVGDRVALPWLGYACGSCRYCNSGRETLCPHQINTGYGMNGGFAEYARITGATVVAIDTNEARLETARTLGADHLVLVGEEDPAAAIQRLGGADVAVATAVNPSAFEQAIASLARGGTLVCVGLPAENELRVPIFQTVLGGLGIRGSIVGTHHDLEEVFDLHRRGLTRVFRSERQLDDVNDAIEQVLDGSAPEPRTVFRLAPAPTPKLTGAAAAQA